MKACVLEGIGNLVYKEVPVPEIKDDEVLLKVKACGICSSDIPRIFTTGTYHFPTVPGHEFSGEIVDAGKHADRNLIGRRAAVFPLLPCGGCPSCQTGEYARCEQYNYYGSRCDGGFAEYLAVRAWNLVLFAEQLSFTEAALCEPASVAKHCVDAGHIEIGSNVVVVGTGTIGLLAALWAKEAGADKVILVGRSRAKLEFAEGLGIETFVNISEEDAKEAVFRLTGNRGADVSLECVGGSQAVSAAVNTVKKGGRVVLTGNPDGDITLGRDVYWKILRNELAVSGIWNSRYNGSRNDWRTTLDYMASGRLKAGKLITHTFPLEECRQALETVRSRDVFSIKVMFKI